MKKPTLVLAAVLSLATSLTACGKSSSSQTKDIVTPQLSKLEAKLVGTYKENVALRQEFNSTAEFTGTLTLDRDSSGRDGYYTHTFANGHVESGYWDLGGDSKLPNITLMLGDGTWNVVVGKNGSLTFEGDHAESYNTLVRQ